MLVSKFPKTEGASTIVVIFGDLARHIASYTVRIDPFKESGETIGVPQHPIKPATAKCLGEERV